MGGSYRQHGQHLHICAHETNGWIFLRRPQGTSNHVCSNKTRAKHDVFLTSALLSFDRTEIKRNFKLQSKEMHWTFLNGQNLDAAAPPMTSTAQYGSACIRDILSCLYFWTVWGRGDALSIFMSVIQPHEELSSTLEEKQMGPNNRKFDIKCVRKCIYPLKAELICSENHPLAFVFNNFLDRSGQREELSWPLVSA